MWTGIAVKDTIERLSFIVTVGYELFFKSSWLRVAQSLSVSLTRDDPFSILPLRSQEDSEAFLDFPIVPRNMSRQNSSQVLDFVHGRSLRFQDFSFSYLRYERSLTVPNCLECGQLPDSAFHKLFECTAVRDVEGLRDELRDISSYEMNFHLPLIFSQDKQLKSNGRKLMRAVVEQSINTTKTARSVHGGELALIGPNWLQGSFGMKPTPDQRPHISGGRCWN
eukprot:sb/3469734/